MEVLVLIMLLKLLKLVWISEESKVIIWKFWIWEEDIQLLIYQKVKSKFLKELKI